MRAAFCSKKVKTISPSHTHTHTHTQTHSLFPHTHPRVINCIFFFKSSFVTVINRCWSARCSLKIDSTCDKRCVRVFFFSLLPVTGAWWKRSKCVIWSASLCEAFELPVFFLSFFLSFFFFFGASVLFFFFFFLQSLGSSFATCRSVPCVYCIRRLLLSDRPRMFAYENVKLCHLHNYRQRAPYKTALKSLVYDCPLFFFSFFFFFFTAPTN